MSQQQLSESRKYAKAFESALVAIFATGVFGDVDLAGLPSADGEPLEINVTETYEEAGVFGNRGLILFMSDGAQVRLTINAYTPAGAR